LDDVGGTNAVVAFPNFKNKFKFLIDKKEMNDLFSKFLVDPSADCNYFLEDFSFARLFIHGRIFFLGLSQMETQKFNAYIYKKYPRLGEKVLKEDEVNFNCGIPIVIFSLTNLVSLNLSYQGITRVTDEIRKLRNLKELLLDNCVRLESLSGEIANLPLVKISLANCLSLKTPPIEISR
jgi:hypothetical protein